MKRRAIILIIVAVLIFSTCSCKKSSGSTTNSYFDDEGTFFIEEDQGRTTMPKSLPYDIPYNNKSISLDDVSFYQLYLTNDYSYTLYAIATIDVSSLGEDEIYWLRKSDISVRSYLTCEENDYDFDSMSYLGSLLVDSAGTLCYVFLTMSLSKENRYSFGGSEVGVSIDVTQEEEYEYTYKGKTYQKSKQETLTYKTAAEDELPGVETIEEPLYSYIVKWLKEKADHALIYGY